MVDERDEDLLKVYNKIMRFSWMKPMSEVYDSIVASPSRRFWVTGERAYAAINAMRRGRCDNQYPLRQQMYIEIEHRARKLMCANPGMTMLEACKRAVKQPAPSFYLSRGTVANVLSRLIHADSILNRKHDW